MKSILKKIGGKFNSLFFSEKPDYFWGLFCVFFSLITINYIMNKSLGMVESNPYYPLPLFEFFRIPSPSAAIDFLSESFGLFLFPRSFFELMKLIVCGALALSALGLIFQRFFIGLSLASFFLYQGWLYGFIRSKDDSYVYHSLNIVVFILLIWMLAPSNSRWKAGFWIGRILKKARKAPPLKTAQNTYPAWPRLLIITSMATSYFGSFYSKLSTSGFHWIDGHTLQSYLLIADIIHPLSYGGWLASQNFYLIWALNISVWIFQSTAPFGFLHPKTRLLYALIGIKFHLSVFLFLGFPFIPFQWYYVIFLPELFQFFQNLLQKINLAQMQAHLRKVYRAAGRFSFF